MPQEVKHTSRSIQYFRSSWLVMALLIAGKTLAQQGPALIEVAPSTAISTYPPNGATMAISVRAIGDPPLNFQWRFNGVDLPREVITVVAGNGSYVDYGDGHAASESGIAAPAAVALGPGGDLYVGEVGASIHVRRIDGATGIISTVGGTQGYGSALAIDASGALYATPGVDTRGRVIRRDRSGTVEIFAGSDQSGYSGDGGPATQAQLNGSMDLALDPAGNLFIADTGNHCIRMVDGHGVIHTVAGNGTAGYSGDGGPASNANLSTPLGIAVDGRGQLFIADTGNRVVRKVDAQGVISTVAGNGAAEVSGDGGPAVSAGIPYPERVAIDRLGALYISDSKKGMIRRVDPNGMITRFAGDGTGVYAYSGVVAARAGLLHPRGLAVDVDGSLLVAEALAYRVCRISPGTNELLINQPTPADFGTYDVLVSNRYGSVRSPAIRRIFVPPLVDIRTATASATVFNGRVSTVTVTDSGAGYTTNLPVTITGGGGSGATGVALQVGGSINQIRITGGGSGYTQSPTVTIAPPETPPLVVSCAPSQDLRFDGLTPGIYYELQHRMGEAWIPQQSRILVSGTSLTLSTLDRGEYSLGPGIPYRAAAASVVVLDGVVLRVDMLDFGQGYQKTPVVSISDSTGTGARAEAVMNQGSMVAVRVLAQGRGYSPKPRLQIDYSLGDRLLPTRRLKLTLSITGLRNDSRYQIQGSRGLDLFENLSESFRATNSLVELPVNATDDAAFVRVVPSP